MYVSSAPDPEELKFYDKYDATWYWCVETQIGFGPDGKPVGPHDCKNGRGCCKD
jgi:hypothetical protein